MRPEKNSLDLLVLSSTGGVYTMPERIDFDFLLPNGLSITLNLSRAQTLDSVRQALWKDMNARNVNNKWSFHSFRPDPIDSSRYVLASITQDAKQVEFYDLEKRLCDLGLLFPFFQLIESQEIDLSGMGGKEGRAYLTELNTATGLYLNEMDMISVKEIYDEADLFRGELFLILKQNMLKERFEIGNNEMNYYLKRVYTPNLLLDVSLLDPTNFLSRSVNGISLNSSSLSSANKQSTIDIQIHVTQQAYELKSINIFEYTPDRLLVRLAELVLKTDKSELLRRFRQEHLLNVCGCDEILYGDDHKLGTYKYIQTCVSKSTQPNFYLVPIGSLGSKIQNDIDFRLELVDRLIAQKEASKSNTESTTSVSSWSTRTPFSIYLDSAIYLPYMRSGECDRLFVKLAIYHGPELRAYVESDKLELDRLGKDSSLRLNQLVTLDSTLLVSDLHRCSKLCISLFCVSKKKREFFSIGWISLNMFDHRGNLLTGRSKLHLWPTVHSTFAAQCMSDVTGQNPNKDFIRLNVEFMKKDRLGSTSSNTSTPRIVYPSHEQLMQCIHKMASLHPQDDCLDIAYAIENDNALLESILNKDALAELTEQEKTVLWRRRDDCVNYPHSLPKLYQSVKWTNQRDLIQFYCLLFRWPDVKPVTAIELLSNMYADMYVRNFAVRCLEKHIRHEEVQQYLLQLVQSLKNEPYYDNSLARFLLRRALESQRIGFDLFWNLKSEMKNPRYKYRFGLLLEAYCRGICRLQLRDLLKQIRVVDKLSNLAQEIKSNPDNLTLVKTSYLKDTLEQADYQETLSQFISPLNRAHVLGKVNGSKCKILTSAKRPLYLSWSNTMPFSKLYQDTYDLIFKHGDDLRQDMLTIQILKLMDLIWKSEGLDFKMLLYDCFSTGSKIGFIEVIKNAMTLFKIQMEGGMKGRYQIDPNQLLRWIIANNFDSQDKSIELFTLSCAGFCVATFILGIGDRHPDNIMVNKAGQLFHIDFGHFLGHFKKKYGIKRERVPFVLTEDFAKVITNGALNPVETDKFQSFKNLCELAYMTIRRYGQLIINLFTLMLSSGMPELQGIEDIMYLRKTLCLDESNEKALEFFQSVFDEAYRMSYTTKLDWMCHALNKKNLV